MRRLLFILLAASTLPAQTLPPAPTMVLQAPFSAQRIYSLDLRLGDGTGIHKTSTSDEARDNAGRTYSHTTTIKDGHTFEHYTVYDPNTRTEQSWCSCSHNLFLKRFGDPLPARTPPANPPETVYIGPRNAREKYHVEQLPQTTLFGLEVRGTRAVRTVPAGAEGNSRELTTTVQSWYSPQLHLALTTIIDDPVKGLSKHEFINLQQVEPPPALFLPPPGLTPKEAGQF